ncbi:MAG: redox-regulated ATPase YchF, partial [Acidobacteria bacterium]
TTLFRLLTGHAEPAAHGRLEATLGIARVPDGRLDRLVELYSPRKRVPATVGFADLAAVPQGGAAALVDVAVYRDADALVHVLRGFGDPNAPRGEGSTAPARDAQSMEDELILADLAVAERRLERIGRDLKKGRNAELEKERDLIDRCKSALEQGKPLRTIELEREDEKRLRGFQFLSAKPLLLVVNLDEADVGWLADPGRTVRETGLGSFLERGATRAVGVCAKIELEIAELDPNDTAAFLADLGLAESGVDRVIRAAYDLLGYISFFTVGEDECRAWSIPRGTTAQEAAGEIHSDLARGFIRAEVVPFERLSARGSMHACREHGEVRLEGKDYVVQDGDVITVRFAT